MKLTGLLLTATGLGWLGWMAWQDGRSAPPRWLFASPGPKEEAAYCLATAERIREITRGRGDPGMERHLDEQIAFWRLRAGSALGHGRAALAQDSNAGGQNEQAYLHLAVQDCALRAIGFYGHRFPSLDAAGG